MKKANVINWLGNYQIEDKKTPLDNEIILHAYGKTWLLELDRDGANALTISPTDYKNKSYNETHSILVFSTSDLLRESNQEEKILNTISELNCRLYSDDR